MQKHIRFYMFKEQTHPADDVLTAFVELVAKEEHVEFLERVLDDKNRLSQFKLMACFSAAMAQVLAKPDLWKNYTDHPEGNRWGHYCR